ncbi:MAG: hypothetical protein ED557_06490 [Balneola sp.]|nr:MAG: hypothetical protein ED557_06490 [Balneola sp.]
MNQYRFKFLVIVFLFSGTAVAQTVSELYQSSIQAYEEKRFEDFLEYALKADSLRPNHRILLYNVVAGYALTGNSEKAYEVLKSRAQFYAVNDFEEDEDFASLSEEYFEELRSTVNLLNEPIETSEFVFEIKADEFHAEDIVYHEKLERFFLSDVRNGYIYSVGREGEDLRKEFDLKAMGYWSALGIAFDPNEENTLWVSSSMMNVFSGYIDSLDGKSVVMSLDIRKNKVLEVFELPGRHVLGEIIFSDSGDLYISDSIEPYIYGIKNGGDEIESLYTNPGWMNLQGLAIDEAQNRIFVSDYITGTFIVDIESGLISRLDIEGGLISGTDGLTIYKDKLIYLQNGTTPKRIAISKLDGSRFEFLDRALPFLNEPTMGVIVGDEFYFIANSPWPYYSRESEPLLEEWSPIQIRKLVTE